MKLKKICFKACDKSTIDSGLCDCLSNFIPNKDITLEKAKEIVAERYGKESWETIQRDFEYGVGISKLLSLEELMDIVAECYKNGGELNF